MLSLLAKHGLRKCGEHGADMGLLIPMFGYAPGIQADGIRSAIGRFPRLVDCHSFAFKPEISDDSLTSGFTLHIRVPWPVKCKEPSVVFNSIGTFMALVNMYMYMYAKFDCCFTVEYVHS